MRSAGVDRRGARRRVLAARVAAGIAAGLAVAAWMVGWPGALPDPRPEPAVGPSPAASLPDDTLRPAALDRERVQALAERLELTSGRARPVPDSSSAASTPTLPGGKVWRYFGPLYVGQRVEALVDVAGRQYVVREGSVIDGTRVVQITSEAITIEDARGRREVTRQARGDAVVAWVRNVANAAPAGATTAAAVRGAMTGVPGATSAAALGDPAQAQRALQMLRERMGRGGPAGTPQGSAGGDPTAARGSASEDAGDQRGLAIYEELRNLENKMRIQLNEGSITPEQFRTFMRREYEARGLNFDESRSPGDVPN